MSISDAVMRDSLQSALDFRLNALPDEKDLIGKYEFSEGFQKKIKALIEGDSQQLTIIRSKRILKRLLIAAVITVLLLSTVFGVSAIRERVVNFFVNVTRTETQVLVRSQGEAEKFIPAIKADYIPEGYKFKYKENEKNIYVNYVYENEDGKEFYIKKEKLLDMSFHLNTEKYSYEDVDIEGMNGFYYLVYNIGNMVFVSENSRYAIVGEISKDELIKIAKSLH